MLGGGLAKKKKKISNIFFFCHEEHFLLRTTPKGRESRSEARTHVHTWNRLKISQVRDATINTFIAFNEGFGGLPGVKNHLWKHFFCGFSWRFQISHFWKHLRQKNLQIPCALTFMAVFVTFSVLYNIHLWVGNLNVICWNIWIEISNLGTTFGNAILSHGFKIKRAHLKACTDWSVRVCMLNWKCEHAILEACTCSTGVVHMLNWKLAHA